MADVTALRDALLEEYAKWERPWGTDWFAIRLDALIAAVEARAALTPERLAKALAVALRGDPTPGYRHTPRTDRQYEALAGRVLAALATDEAVP